MVAIKHKLQWHDCFRPLSGVERQVRRQDAMSLIMSVPPPAFHVVHLLAASLAAGARTLDCMHGLNRSRTLWTSGQTLPRNGYSRHSNDQHEHARQASRAAITDTPLLAFLSLHKPHAPSCGPLHGSFKTRQRCQTLPTGLRSCRACIVSR